MEPNTGKFEWILQDDKLRNGRHGPVFMAMNTTTGELLTAERLDLKEPALSRALTNLQQQQQQQQQQHQHQQHTVPFLGHQRKGNHFYLLSTHLAGGTLGDLVRQYGPSPVSLTRTIARCLVRGLDQIYIGRGLAAVFLDAEHVWLDNRGAPRIEVPLLDITVAGQRLLPPALLTLPEFVSGNGGLQNADVWLLGVILVKMLSGRPDLVADYASATAVGARVLKQHQTSSSALELLASDKEGPLTEDPVALDFVRQCLTMQSQERPGISELLAHSFLTDEANGEQ